MQAELWRLYWNSLLQRTSGQLCHTVWLLFYSFQTWKKAEQELEVHVWLWLPKYMQWNVPCNCDGFVGTNPSQLHESLHVGATSVIFPPCYYWKNKSRMFCLPPVTVTGTVSQMCYSPSVQQRSLFDNSSLSPALYSACARSWPEVIDSRLAPECYFVLLKVSLERARSCLPLCSPHATWTCSLPSSRYTTLAWRWDTSHSVLP